MEVSDYLRVLRAHWVAIISSALIGGLLGFAFSIFTPPVYKADSTGTVIATSSTDDPNTALLYENLAKSTVKSYLQWAQSRSVAESAIESLSLTARPEDLVRRIQVENPEDTPVIKVTAEAPTPKAARDLAKAWLDGLAKEGKRLNGSNPGSPAALTLSVTESAALPSSPSFPNKKLSLLIGTAFGLFCGLVYSVFRSRLDRRLRSVEQLESAFESPTIGAIPVEKSLEAETSLRLNSSGEAYDPRYLHSPMAEAMRELRTNLRFMNVDAPPKTIVLSSPLPGDGKSTVSANLAISIAASGQRVVLVDADLRRPTVAKTFGLVEGVGLTDVLTRSAEISDVLQQWGTSGNLFVLGAGKHPPNPSELLGSQAMQHLLKELSDHALVIIDAPPLIPVTDAAILASRTDGVIVVASAGKTTDVLLDKALHSVSLVNGKILGLVLNRVPQRGPNSSYYSAKYASYYAANETGRRSNKMKKRARTRSNRVKTAS